MTLHESWWVGLDQWAFYERARWEQARLRAYMKLPTHVTEKLDSVREKWPEGTR